MRKLEVGEYVVVRDLRVLLDGTKTVTGRQYLLSVLKKNIELENFMMLTVLKVSARKYRIDEVMTEDNSAVLAEAELTLTADWYDIKLFNAVQEVTYINELFGEVTELRLQGDM